MLFGDSTTVKAWKPSSPDEKPRRTKVGPQALVSIRQTKHWKVKACSLEWIDALENEELWSQNT